MSEETTQAPVISRNGQDMTLVEQTFGKKSNNAGKKFFSPETSSARFMTDLPWYGLDYFVALLNKTTRRVFGEIYTDNIDEKTGVFNGDQWALDAADFTAGISKLSDLTEDLDELVGLQQTYALDDQFGEEVNGEMTERAKELQAKVTEVAHKIKPIRAQIASIKEKYAERAEKRKAKEAASKTAQPAGEAVTA